jgi:hypothetical protein
MTFAWVIVKTAVRVDIESTILHPSYGGIDYDHLGVWAGTMRAGVSLAPPMIAAKPKRLTKQNR